MLASDTVSSEIGSRIAKNSFFNVLRTCITLPITLAITPYIIRRLGTEEFGVWVLVGVISSYAQLSDFGITESLIKFVAEYKAKNEYIRLNQLINTAMIMYLVLGIICCSLFILAIPFVVVTILHIPLGMQDTAIYIFKIAIVLFFINMLMGVFGSLITGFQRMGYSNLINVISVILTALGTVYFLGRGYGLRGLILTNALVAGVTVCSNVLVARHLFPEMRINPLKYFSLEQVSSIFTFSWKVQISNVTQLMIFQVDRVLLSHYVGLNAVSIYEVANRIASQARGLIVSVFSPMIPASSALQAQNEEDRVTGLYRRSFKYMGVISVLFSALVIALAHPFIETWMGSGFEKSAVTLQILMVAYAVNLLTGPGAFILSGINKPHIGMRSSLLAGISNLVLCITLVGWIGYFGIVVGIFISILVSGFYFIWMVHANIPGLNWNLYRQTLVRPLSLAVLIGIPLALVAEQWHVRGYVMLCLLAICYAIPVVIGIWKGSYLDEFDRSLLCKLNPLGRYL